MMTGNMWLLDTVGVAPKNAWAIDPFGHSPTMAYLLGKMGFQNMLIQRTHYEVKKVLALEQNLEFNWRQSWDSLNTTDIFCHMMPFYSYDIPHTCGPEPGVCCQFDYWRSPGRAGSCPWGKHPVEITSANVKERAEMLLDQYRKKSTLYRTNTLLVPLGDDFRYIRVEEAELQFQNYQLLFDYINDHPHLKAKAQFGTLEDYFGTLRLEVKHKTQSKQSSLRAVAGFPALSGDFFTYADREHHYWSGYYVTRPFYKAVDRILEATLRAADIFFTLSHAACRPSDSANFPLNLAESLEAARRDLSLFQHHDGVTGTAKDHVVRDYARRMHTAIVNLENLMASSVGTLLTKSSKIGQCSNLGLNNFEPQHMRTTFNTLPESKALQTKENHFQRVVVYNPLEETIEQVVTIMVDDPAVCVVDSEGESIESQLSPDWGKAIEPTTSSGKHRLQFEVQVPALGLQTYLVTTDHHEGCKPAFLSTLTVFNQPSEFSCPHPYTCVYKKEETTVISNQHQKLEFDSRTGLLTSMRSYSTGKNFKVDEEIAMYSSAGSGAYLFLPSGEAVPIVQPGGLILVTQGPIMQEVHTKPSCLAGYTPLVRSARLFSGSSVQALVAEIEYHVELVEAKFNNKELIARFKTEINNKQVFHTDLNGFQTIRRETYAKIPLQGNYYPMPSLAFLQCPGGRRFSIHSRQALGVASLKKGELEVMLDRRLTQDDDRGLGQGIMDNEPSRVIFHLLLEFNTSLSVAQSSSPKVPSMLSHRVGAQLSYPLNVFFSKPEPILNLPSTLRTGTLATSYQTLEADLPCDLHVVSLKTPQPKSVSSPMSLNYGILLQRRGWDSAYTAGQDLKCDTTAERSIDLFTMFKHFKVSRAQKTSLNFIHDDSNLFGKREYSHRKEGSGSALKLGVVELNPMEIQGFKFDLQASN
jgi:alpha-mannosidase II